MTLAEGLQTFAGRLVTFENPKQVNKRRASNNKKKQPTTVVWPHEDPDPEALAKAGFYYKPSASSTDSVTCFLCNKALDGWDVNDNPAIEHLNHVPDCGWAISCCIEQRSQDMDRAEEDPLSENMMESRRMTFRDWWPHEGKKGWKCKIKKMVEAGWSYSPLPEADDCVTCFYCSVSLDGWEPKDDPWHEHRKRAPDCHFFTLVEEAVQLKKASKSKKGRSTRTSKTSRQSVQSTSVAEEESSALREPPVEEGESLLSVASDTSGPNRSRKQNNVRKVSSRTKKNDTRATLELLDEAVDVQQIEDDLNMELEHSEEAAEEAPKASTPAKNTRRARKKVFTSESILDDSQHDPKPRKTRGAKGTRGGKKQQETTNESDAADIEPNDTQRPDTKQERPRRGTKRTSDGSEKLNSSVMVLIEPPKHLSRPLAEPGKQENVNDKSPEVKEPRKQTKQKKAPNRKKQPSSKTTEANEELTQSEDVPPPATAEVQFPPQAAQDASVGEDNDTQLDENKQQATPPPSMHDPSKSSPIAQASDAENQPPSLKPATSRGSLHSPAILVQTPKTSPSKRNLVSVDAPSSNAWQPIDIEGVFLPSPSHAQLATKENFTVETIMQNLANHEKSLTVEQWIRKNGGEAEERLRAECERMILKFEDEGNRALATMESIQCV